MTLAEAVSQVTSGFGKRIHPIKKTLSHHDGIDISAPTGAPVYAVGAGAVHFAGVKGSYGNTVFIQHDGGQMTVYAHLSRIDVAKGQALSRGDRIGAVGTTGDSTAPHLHFEVRQDGKQVDPLLSLLAGANPLSPSRHAMLAKAHSESAPSFAPTNSPPAGAPFSMRCLNLMRIASLEALHAHDWTHSKKECSQIFR